MSAHRLYHTWFGQIQKLWPTQRVTRLRTLTWMVVGLYLGRSVHLSAMAIKLPLPARLTSVTDRFRRFLHNPAFRVRRWYRPVAEQLLARAAATGGVRLILDGSKVGARQQLLMVALAYRRRALPIAWTWVKGARGHSGGSKQRALLRYVHTLIPSQASVQVVGDCEFGTIPVARQLERWGWHYVLRQKGNTQICVSRTALVWCDFARSVPCRDQRVWHPDAPVTIKHLHRAHLVGYWARGEAEPWLLITNLGQGHEALRAYRRRMWIEEMFGDWKGHGVDVEGTRLRRTQRLSRLIFIVALWYLWLVTRGAQAIKSGAGGPP